MDNNHSSASVSARGTLLKGGRTRTYVGLLLVTLAGLLAMLAYFLWTSYQQAIYSAEVASRNLVQVMESRVRSDLDRVAGMLEFVAGEVRPEQMQWTKVNAHKAGLSARLTRLLTKFPQVAVTNVFDAQGRLLYSSSPIKQVFNIADREHFQRLRDGQSEYLSFSKVQISRSTGYWSLVLARTIRDGSGHFNGVVTAVINLHEYAKLFSTIDVGSEGEILIRRSDDSALVMRYPLADMIFNRPLPKDNPISQRISAGERMGTLIGGASADAIDRIASFQKLDDYPFYVQVSIARNHYLAPWRMQAAVASGLTAVFALIFALVVIRMIQADSRAEAISQRLSYREALFSALFDQSNFLAGILDSNARLLEVNDRALAVIGCRREDVLGCFFPETPWWSRGKERSALVNVLEAAAKGQRGAIEVAHPLADGSEMIVLFHAIPVHAGQELFIAVSGVDITELKRTQQLLDQSRERMELALSGGDLGLWDWHLPSDKVVFSERWCSMLGYRQEEIQPDADSWCRLVHPDDLPLVDAVVKRHLKGELPAYECEYRMRHQAGHWIWILVRGRIVERNVAGVPLRAVGTHMDISVRKQAEAEILRSNSELEQFSYSISHDMRQPLRMIASYLQLIEMSLLDQLDDEKRGYFHFAVDGAKRLDSMLLGLLEYSRVGRKGEPPVEVESRAMLEEALLFLQPAIVEARAEIQILGEWPRIIASPDEILRLLQNLIGNALKFRVAGRRPEIVLSSAIEDDWWRLCVVDNGIGVLPSQAERLFQMFQRLQSRAAYEGTGVGLALCRKIAEHHGGRIWVESVGEGKGSTFIVELPMKPR